MSLRAILDAAAFDALPDESKIGKDLFKKNEKDNQFYLDLSGDEAGKLAIPLQESVKKLEDNNKKLLDEKVKKEEEIQKFSKLGKTAEEIEKILKDGQSADRAAIEAEYQTKLKSVEEAAKAKITSFEEQVSAASTTNKALMDQIIAEKKRSVVAELKNQFEMNALGDDYLSNRIQIVPEEEGSMNLVARVFENGELAYKAGKYKSPAELAEEARANADLAGMFNAGTAGGSGGRNTSGEQVKRGGMVNAGDAGAMSANFDKIASGEVAVG